MHYSKKEFVKVVRVEYPSRMGYMYGVLEQDPKGNALFVPMDHRFPKMIVLEVSSEVATDYYTPQGYPFSLLINS